MSQARELVMRQRLQSWGSSKPLSALSGLWGKKDLSPRPPKAKTKSKERKLRTREARLISQLLALHGFSSYTLAKALTERTGRLVTPDAALHWGRGREPRATWDGVLLPALEQLVVDTPAAPEGAKMPALEVMAEVEDWMRRTGAADLKSLADWLGEPRTTVVRWARGLYDTSRFRIETLRTKVRTTPYQPV